METKILPYKKENICSTRLNAQTSLPIELFSSTLMFKSQWNELRTMKINLSSTRTTVRSSFREELSSDNKKNFSLNWNLIKSSKTSLFINEQTTFRRKQVALCWRLCLPTTQICRSSLFVLPGDLLRSVRRYVNVRKGKICLPCQQSRIS